MKLFFGTVENAVGFIRQTLFKRTDNNDAISVHEIRFNEVTL